MELSPEAVNAYKELITNPQGNGFEFPPLEACFEKSEVATPKHILFQEYLNLIKKPLPKVFFYIIMDEIYWAEIAQAPDGNLGYKLKIKA